jgi:hypothetical protein
LASAAASAPILLLERCMRRLVLQELKVDGAGFGSFGAQPMACGLPGVIRHQRL